MGQHVVLVGGFSASDWLFSEAERQLADQGLVLLRPDNQGYVCITPPRPALKSLMDIVK